MLATKWHRRGYRYLHTQLRRKGFLVNHKGVYRLYKAEGLTLRRKSRGRRPAAPRAILGRPGRPAEQSCMDFMSDALVDGRRFRVLNITDVFTRESLVMEVGTSMLGCHVVRMLDQAVAQHGKPERITVDNGPEFIGNALDRWAYANGVGLVFVRPGKPQDNPFIGSFNGRTREECLNAQVPESSRRKAEGSGVAETVQRGEDAQQSEQHDTLGIQGALPSKSTAD